MKEVKENIIIVQRGKNNKRLNKIIWNLELTYSLWWDLSKIKIGDIF